MTLDTILFLALQILFLIGTWGISKTLDRVLATLERIEKKIK